jgi:COMPASS component SWD3
LIFNHTLGHTSRIWDVASRSDGQFVASASGDTTIKLWDIRHESIHSCSSTLTGNEGDVYSVQFHPTGDYILSGGYDKVVRLYDIERETITKTFSGHFLSVSKAIFTPLGNLIIR